MGFLSKLKLLIKARKPIGEFVNQVKGAKLKYKTIPFWITLIGTGLSVVGAFQGVIPATAAAVITAVLTSGYNILRGADKMNQEGVKPPLKSTEFWVGAAGIISAGLMQIKAAGVNNEIITVLVSLIGGAMAVAQNLGAQQPDKSDS